MKIITKFECEKCHKSYDSMEDAMKCEEHHIIPVEVFIPKNYGSPLEEVRAGYPRRVHVRMHNGDVTEYIFDSIIYRMTESEEKSK